ncbi:hypothetical protein [Rhodopila globiformis]|uniref:hypothetical protein n=1 Tax=Rhodopila globiformis TaxID=1071 RepID=UPI0013048AB5|nr:hypothetical protein [Rhodopila globiformis]
MKALALVALLLLSACAAVGSHGGTSAAGMNPTGVGTGAGGMGAMGTDSGSSSRTQ